MIIDYDEAEDTLFIRFSDKPVVRDISYGWNIHVGMTDEGIGQITILEAKADGLLPLRVPEKVLQLIRG
jgi:uncharacterized protein DUF2283